METGYDHIKLGRSLIHFVYPPAVLPEISGFKDGLKGAGLAKLYELLERCAQLKFQKEVGWQFVVDNTEIGSLEEDFFATLTFCEYSEYYIIQKWVNYWLGLWYKVTVRPLPKKLNLRLGKVDEEDIARAKQNPIQDHFPGKLRKFGLRLVGLCPLHQEKTPSFNIYTQTNTFHCFGCQATGDSISFVQQTQNLSFPEAVRSLI